MSEFELYSLRCQPDTSIKNERENMITLTPDQTHAIDMIMGRLSDGARTVVLRGSAGTGKTTCMRELIRRLSRQGRGVVATAPTNKATKVLGGKIGDICETRTTHSLLGLRPEVDPKTGDLHFKPDRSKEGVDLSDIDVIVVDEASMLGKGNDKSPGLIQYLEEACLPYGTGVVFVGDPAQLPPVNESESPALVASPEDTVNLTQILRYSGPILRYANHIRVNQSDRYRPDRASDFGLESIADEREFMAKAVARFLSGEFMNDPDHVRILCWTNEAVRACCRQVHSAIYGSGADPWQPHQTVVASKPVVVLGSVVMATSDEAVIENKPELTEVNGVLCWELQLKNVCKLHVVSRAGVSAYTARLETLKREAFEAEGWRRSKAWGAYYQFDSLFAKLDPVYAQTVHKSQGSTYRHVFVHRGDIFKNRDFDEAKRCYYTAITRASESLTVLE